MLDILEQHYHVTIVSRLYAYPVQWGQIWLDQLIMASPTSHPLLFPHASACTSHTIMILLQHAVQAMLMLQ